MSGLARELAEATALAERAGALVVAARAAGLVVEHKAGDEPVTAADRDASTLIVAGLHAAFPADVVVSEELEDDLARLGADRVWFVDPIDGTKDFIRGGDGFAVMIGLVVGGVPVVGGGHQPSIDRTFAAIAGQAATVRERGQPAVEQRQQRLGRRGGEGLVVEHPARDQHQLEVPGPGAGRALGVEPRELVGAEPPGRAIAEQIGDHRVELHRAAIAEHLRRAGQAIGQALDAGGHGFPKVRRAKARAKATSSGSLATRYGVTPAARSLARCGS